MPLCKRMRLFKDIFHAFFSVSVPGQGILLEDVIPYLSCMHFSKDIRIISACFTSYVKRYGGESQDKMRVT